MNTKTLDLAVAEARRFVAAASVVKAGQPVTHGGNYNGNPATGHLRRASMDLTRALARLRNSNA